MMSVGELVERNEAGDFMCLRQRLQVLIKRLGIT